MQTLFSRGPSATIRMLVLVLASITLMTADHRWKSLEFVRSALSSALYPIQYTIDLPIRLYYWADEVFSAHQTLLDKNREFEARHLENRVQLQRLGIIEKENARLRRLLSAPPKTTERLLIAAIIHVDSDPNRQLITLNKGSQHDVYLGQPILDANGIMGQVIHVSPLTSTAMLITDVSHAIPVQVDRTGLRANAVGTGKIDQLKLRYLQQNVDLNVGDTLITSGFGGTFPPNYPVAIISEVERPLGEQFAVIKAAPLALLDKTREVLLVWRNTVETYTEGSATPAETSSEASADNQTADDYANDDSEKQDASPPSEVENE